MSSVTDILILTAIEETGMEVVNKYFSDTRYTLKEVSDYSGGNKAFQADVFMAAINYFALDEFLEFLQTVEWENPECVQVLIKREHDDNFKVYTYNRIRPGLHTVPWIQFD